MNSKVKPQKTTLSVTAFVVRLLTSVLLINLFIIALAGLSLKTSLQHYEEQVMVMNQNLSQSLEANISGIINKADVAMLAVIDEAEKQLANGGINELALNTYIARQLERVPELDGIRMTNAAGYTAYGTGVVPDSLAYNGDRDYYPHAKNNSDPKAEPFISKPMFGRVAKKWVLNISRRVNNPDGSFAGVAYSAISLDSILKLFSSLDVGINGAFTLRDGALEIITRYPELNEADKSNFNNIVPQELQNLVNSGHYSGTYKSTSSLDKIQRLYSFHKVSRYSLYVTAGRSTKEYISKWKSDASKVFVLVALFSIVTVFASWLIFLRWHNEKMAEEELLNRSYQLEQLVNQRTVELELRNKTLAEEVVVRTTAEKVLQEREDELKRTLNTVRNFAKHTESVREYERKRIAREIHDDLGQMLTALRFGLYGLRDKFFSGSPSALEYIGSMVQQTSASIKSVQRICADLRPQMLDNLGLAEALDWHAKEFSKHTSIKSDFRFDIDVLQSINSECATVLFRVFQEILTNIARHAEATQTTGFIISKDGGCLMEVEDNGKGITTSELFSSQSFGIIGIRERVGMCAGSVEIVGKAGKGTVVRVFIPCLQRGTTK